MTQLRTSTMAEEGVSLAEWSVVSDTAGESPLVYPAAARGVTEPFCATIQESI